MNDRNEEFGGGMPSPFLQLVLMLSTTAMQHLGKLVNPATNKAEVNLDGAQFLIDMLGALEEKTRGNLTAEESRNLTDVLVGLRLNYVDTAQADAAAPAPGTGGTEAVPPKADGEEAKSGDADPGPRYRKTYD
jgi:hypothetical protein